METPLVTVICLCYNHERFVREAVTSVLAQTYSPIQIIIADDNSTDHSPAIITGLKTEHPSLELILSSQNLGNCKAFNNAYAQAKGEFIIDFATDDIMEPQRVAMQVQLFMQHDRNTGVIFTDATYVDEEGKFIRNHYDHLFKHGLIRNIPEGDVYRHVLTTYFIASPTMMIRRSVLDTLGGYDPSLSYEDFDLWVRSSRQFKYAFLNEKLTRIRKLRKSLSTGWYVPGDHQLLSTYKVCLKATLLNRDEGDRQALIQRVRYELRQSVFTSNHKEAKLFFSLLQQLETPRKLDSLLMTIDRLYLPLSPLRKVYYRLRYSQG